MQKSWLPDFYFSSQLADGSCSEKKQAVEATLYKGLLDKPMSTQDERVHVAKSPAKSVLDKQPRNSVDHASAQPKNLFTGSSRGSRSWSFCTSSRDSGGLDWTQSLEQVGGSISSAGELKLLLLAVPPPSLMLVGGLHSFFHAGIKPVREDPHFQHGGRWILELRPSLGSFPEETFPMLVDQVWRELLIAVVEGHVEGSAEACGITFSTQFSTSDRRGMREKVSLWLQNCRDDVAVLAVGKVLADIVGCTIRKMAILSSPFDLDVAFENFRLRRVTHRLRWP